MSKKAYVGGIAALCLVVAVMVAIAHQDKSKRPSPPAKAECDLGGGTTITVDYSSPRAKGRKIYGGLVPYGKVWRAGANEATTFVTNVDINVGGPAVPAGNYTIFVIPNTDKWTLVISKKTGEWGTAYPGSDNDLARINMKPSSLPSAIENFTIAFDKGARAAPCIWIGRQRGPRSKSPRSRGERVRLGCRENLSLRRDVAAKVRHSSQHY